MYSEKANFVANMRLLKKDKDGKVVETIDEMFQRVAKYLASSDEEYTEFYTTMAALDFLPNSPCLVNADVTQPPKNLSACFVLGIDDSISSIYSTLSETAMVHKSGGGTGFNFSSIRPKDALVSSTGGIASGPVSFMRLYDASTDAIKQGGVRRGANIGILSIDHPDIEEFIACKQGDGGLSNFNISVAVTDDFMEAIFHDKQFPLRFNGKVVKTIRAIDLWDKLITNAHLSGDPGIVFLDRINKANPLQHSTYRIEATNPCQPGWTPLRTRKGIETLEQIKVGDDILSFTGWTTVVRKKMTGIKPVHAYVTTHGTFYSTENHEIVSGGQKVKIKDTHTIDYMDNYTGKTITVVIIGRCYVRDEEVYNITVDNESHTYWSFGFNTGNCGEVPLSRDEACCLGSVNWSNMLDANGEVDFDHLATTTKIAVRILNAIIDKSAYPNDAIRQKVLLSRKIGVGVMGVADFFIKLKVVYGSDESLELVNDMCSAMLTSCVKASHDYPATFSAFEHFVETPHIKDALDSAGIENYTPANATLMTIAPTGTLSMLADCSSGIEPVFFFESTENRVGESRKYLHPLYAEFKEEHPRLRVPAYFIESHDVEIDAHIQMQATFQRYVCNAVSKTINLPRTATVADIDKVYKEAYMLGCKGVTAYVDGSLDMQTIEGAGTYANKKNSITPLARPNTLSGATHEIKTGFGPLYVTVNYVDGTPFEVLCNIGKSGASENAKAESVGKLISLALRCGISLEHIIEQIDGIVGSKSQYSEYGLVTSIPDAIAKILTTKVLDGEAIVRTVGMQTCVDCNSTNLHYEGACLVCSACGWKSCGN